MTEIVKDTGRQKDGSFIFFERDLLKPLMVGDIKGTIEANVPIINNINPAAVMSDIFYSLNMYDDYSRFFRCIITLIIMSAVFTILIF